MQGETKSSHAGWASLIEAVKSPLGFFALAILILEGILSIVAARATGTDLTLLIVVIGALALFVILPIAFMVVRKPEMLLETRATPIKQVTQANLKYDAFISSPMAAYSNEADYQQDRQKVLSLISTLKKECDFKSVYYAGENLSTYSEFEATDLSAKDDLKAIEESKYFILIYPQKLASSVLFEAGYALALNKMSIYFAADKSDLPFLMRQAEQAFAWVKIYEEGSMEKIIKLIGRHRDKLFSKS